MITDPMTIAVIMVLFTILNGALTFMLIVYIVRLGRLRREMRATLARMRDKLYDGAGRRPDGSDR